MNNKDYKRRPHWLKVKLSGSGHYNQVRHLVKESSLHTVCASAHCPNIGECWAKRTATFMIMGDHCTRNCRFCAVLNGKPLVLDPDEPEKVALAVKELNLRYAVITSVTRDDLKDGGSSHFSKTIHAIRNMCPGCKVEVLIPDFQGDENALLTVLDAEPDVLNHNVETIARLYPFVRPQADYQRSLDVLAFAKKNGALTKSGIMVGFGETFEEIIQTMRDLRNVNCDLLTVGQYLRPSWEYVPIDRFLSPEEFQEIKKQGLQLGFMHVEAGPLVRSSYHAEEQFLQQDCKNDV